MPLIHSGSKKAIGKNIEIEEKTKPKKQAIAIALNVAREYGAHIKKKAIMKKKDPKMMHKSVSKMASKLGMDSNEGNSERKMYGQHGSGASMKSSNPKHGLGGEKESEFTGRGEQGWYMNTNDNSDKDFKHHPKGEKKKMNHSSKHKMKFPKE